jgi:hypothetical protein
VIEAVVEPVVEPAVPVVEPIVPVIEDLVEPVVPLVEPVVEPIGPVIEAVVEPAVPVIEPVVPVVEDLVEPVIEPVVPLAEPMLEPIAPIVDPPTVLLPPVPGILGAVAPVPDRGDHQPSAEAFRPSSSSSSPPSRLDTPTRTGSEPTAAAERVPLSGEPRTVSVSPGTTAALPAPKSEPQGAGVASVSSPGPHGTPAVFALPCYAAAPMSGLASLASSKTGRVRDSVSGNGPSETPSSPAPFTCNGTSGGSGAGFRVFADLVTLADLAAQPFSRRLQRASAPWRPSAFVAVIERPG